MTVQWPHYISLLAWVVWWCAVLMAWHISTEYALEACPEGTTREWEAVRAIPDLLDFERATVREWEGR